MCRKVIGLYKNAAYVHLEGTYCARCLNMVDPYWWSIMTHQTKRGTPPHKGVAQEKNRENISGDNEVDILS